jgi:hypothetical protein
VSTRLLKGGLWRGTGGVKSLRISGAAAATLLPLLQDSLIIRPWAGVNISGPSDRVPAGQSKSYNIDFRPVGPDQAWTAMDIGLANVGPAYDLQYLAVGRQGMNSLTGNQATGYLGILTSGAQTIPSSGIECRTTWVASDIPLSPASGQNRFRVALQVGEGAPLESYGEWPNYQGLGWVATYQEVLGANLTGGFNVGGGNQGFSMPMLVIRLKGLTTTVVRLPMVGDSTTESYGEANQPTGRAYGIPGRLEARWRSAGVRIAPVNLGFPGYDTAQYNQVIAQLVADGYGFRIWDRQSDSVNNVKHGKATSEIRTDLLAAEALVAPQPMIHRLGPGGQDIADHASDWQAGTVIERTWIKTNRPDLVQAGFETTVTDPVTLRINPGYFYDESEDLHLNSPGYTQGEADMHAWYKSTLDARAGVTL